jgi:hypothetical protein
MRTISIALGVLTAAAMWAGETEPSKMEAYAARPGVKVAWSSEVARWQSNGTVLVVSALVLENGGAQPASMRGVKVDLSSGSASDHIYLDEEASARTHKALVSIADALARNGGHPHGNGYGCMGAAEFWEGYNWEWNKYHELNVSYCGSGGAETLALHGRGRSSGFNIAGHTALELAQVFDDALAAARQH